MVRNHIVVLFFYFSYFFEKKAPSVMEDKAWLETVLVWNNFKRKCGKCGKEYFESQNFRWECIQEHSRRSGMNVETVFIRSDHRLDDLAYTPSTDLAIPKTSLFKLQDYLKIQDEKEKEDYLLTHIFIDKQALVTPKNNSRHAFRIKNVVTVRRYDWKTQELFKDLGYNNYDSLTRLNAPWMSKQRTLYPLVVRNDQ